VNKKQHNTLLLGTFTYSKHRLVSLALCWHSGWRFQQTSSITNPYKDGYLKQHGSGVSYPYWNVRISISTILALDYIFAELFRTEGVVTTITCKLSIASYLFRQVNLKQAQEAW